MFAAELRSIAVGRQAVSELALLALRSVAENLSRRPGFRNEVLISRKPVENHTF